MMQLAILGSNKPFIWLVEPRYTIGKGSDCDIPLRDAGLLDVHLQLRVDGDNITLAPEEGATVRINGSPIKAGHQAKHGDRLILGQSELQIIDPKQAARTPAGSTPEDKSLWALQGLSSALSNRRYSVTGTQAVVGRATTCDISLGVAHLSRQHARLTLQSDGLLVEDLGSSNGTFVNGQRVERAVLKSGDELRFDTLRFRVVAPGAEVDTDKTSLRPAITAAPKAVKPIPAPVQTRTARPKTAIPVRPEVQMAVEVEVEETAAGISPVKLILGAALVAGLGAVWFVFSK